VLGYLPAWAWPNRGAARHPPPRCSALAEGLSTHCHETLAMPGHGPTGERLGALPSAAWHLPGRAIGLETHACEAPVHW